MVDRYARITVRSHRYSVPARLIGRQVRVQLHASELVVFDGRKPAAWHRRSGEKNRQTLVLDHYLEILVRKPGALPGSTALAQARQAGLFTAAHQAFWDATRRLHGDAAGTRALIEVLLLHRRMPHADVVAGLKAAISAGACTADVVAVEARKAGQDQPGPRTADTPRLLLDPPADDPTGLPLAPVISLIERRLAASPAAVISNLPPDPRPVPSVSQYDQLLHMRKRDHLPPDDDGRTEKIS